MTNENPQRRRRRRRRPKKFLKKVGNFRGSAHLVTGRIGKMPESRSAGPGIGPDGTVFGPFRAQIGPFQARFQHVAKPGPRSLGSGSAEAGIGPESGSREARCRPDRAQSGCHLLWVPVPVQTRNRPIQAQIGPVGTDLSCNRPACSCGSAPAGHILLQQIHSNVGKRWFYL